MTDEIDSKTPTDRFIVELPLKTTREIATTISKKIELSRQVYNACIGEALRRLDLMRQSRQYQQATKSRGKSRTQQFNDVRKKFNFSEYDLGNWTTKKYGKGAPGEFMRKALQSRVIVSLAQRAWKAVHMHSVKPQQFGRPRFSRYGELNSIDANGNKTGIRWRDNQVIYGDIRITASVDEQDPVIMHGLKHEVCHVRIVRKEIAGQHRFFVQLTCKGRPYQKSSRQLGHGEVGLDIGPSNVAVVSNTLEKKYRLCDSIKHPWVKERRLKRKLDRQRRATNPQNYNTDGTVKRGVKLRWIESNRYKETKTKLRDISRRLVDQRKNEHGRLSNEILRTGNSFHIEKISKKGWQKRKQCKKTGHKKKSFGKSIGVHAPGMFEAMLKQKATQLGGQIHEIDTKKTKLSQICHGCGAVVKKTLSQRIHQCKCGVGPIDRDIYSARLAQNTFENKLDVGRCLKRWPRAMKTLAGDIKSVLPIGESGLVPEPSSGLEPISRKGRHNRSEVQDVVVELCLHESLEKPRDCSGDLGRQPFKQKGFTGHLVKSPRVCRSLQVQEYSTHQSPG